MNQALRYLWHLLICYSEQTGELPLICDASILMWGYFNDEDHDNHLIACVVFVISDKLHFPETKGFFY